MKVIYTKHAQEKFGFLKELGWNFKPKDIKVVIENPDHYQERNGVKIVLRSLTNELNLRVIYAEISDIIYVITFHPVKKGRYEKKQY